MEIIPYIQTVRLLMPKEGEPVIALLELPDECFPQDLSKDDIARLRIELAKPIPEGLCGTNNKDAQNIKKFFATRILMRAKKITKDTDGPQDRIAIWGASNGVPSWVPDNKWVALSPGMIEVFENSWKNVNVQVIEANLPKVGGAIIVAFQGVKLDLNPNYEYSVEVWRPRVPANFKSGKPTMAAAG